MKEAARRAWERTVAFQDEHGTEPLHTLLCLTWLPFGVLIGGGLVTRTWLPTPQAPLAVAFWVLCLAATSVVGARMQGRVGALVASLDARGPFPVIVFWLWSMVWVVTSLGIASLGGWPFWLAGLAFGLTVSSLQNELLVPMLLAHGPAGVGRMPRPDASFLVERLALGLLAASSATAFVTSPLLAAACVALLMCLWLSSFFALGVHQVTAGAIELVVSAAATALAFYAWRRLDPLVRGIGVALKGCVITALTGFRKVLMSLVGWVVIGFLLVSVRVDMAGFYLLLDGYLNLLLVLLIGRVALAGLTPAFLFLRFYSLGWLAEASAPPPVPLEGETATPPLPSPREGETRALEDPSP